MYSLSHVLFVLSFLGKLSFASERLTFYDSCNTPSCSIDREVNAWPGGTVSVSVRGDFGHIDEVAHILLNGRRLQTCRGGADCDDEYYFCGTYTVDEMESATLHVDSSDTVDICDIHMEVETVWTPVDWATPCNGDNNEVSTFTDSCDDAECSVGTITSQWSGGIVNVQIRGDFNHGSKTAHVVVNGVRKEICRPNHCGEDVYYDCGDLYVPPMMDLIVQVQRSHDPDVPNMEPCSANALEALITFTPSPPQEEFGLTQFCTTASCFVEHTICNWPGGEVNVNIRGDFGSSRETAHIFYYGTDADGVEVNRHGDENQLEEACKGGSDCSSDYFECGKYSIPPMEYLVLHIDSSDAVNFCTKHLEVESLFTPNEIEPMSEDNVLSRARLDTNLEEGHTPSNVAMFMVAFPESAFNTILAERDPLYSYEALLHAVATFPDFCGGTLKQCQMELAFVFGHFTQETGTPGNAANWFTTFKHAEEQDPPSAYVNPACTVCDIYAPVDGVSYHGRGGKMLSWNYNYGAYSQIFLGNKDALLSQPERILEEKHIVNSAMWFYMTPQSPKPSMHDIVLGHWKPAGQRLKMNERFAWTNHVINGAEECTSALEARSVSRYGFFEMWAEYFGWKNDFSNEEWGIIDCSTVGDFGTQVNTLKLFWRDDNTFTDTCGCEFTTTVTAFPRYRSEGHLDALGGLSFCEENFCETPGGSADCRKGVTPEDSCKNLFGGSSRCGTNWDNANIICGHRCEDNQHCLNEGESCQANLERKVDCTGPSRRLLEWYSSQ